METFIAALKTRNVRLPKFLLWKIAAHAGLELDYSLELAEYCHGADTFKVALIRGKKMAERMAENMYDEELYQYGGNILRASCPEYFVLRISDYLVERYGNYFFSCVALSGNVSLLHFLHQNYAETVPSFSPCSLKNIFADGHLDMVEYLLKHDLLHSHVMGYECPEKVLEEIVAKLPKEAVAENFSKAVHYCPITASVLRKYL